MAETQTKYRTDLPFNVDNVPALQRSTLNLADKFNVIFDQVFSNEKKLSEKVQITANQPASMEDGGIWVEVIGE